MTERQFKGTYLHSTSGRLLHYVGRYEFKPIGIVYEADAGFGGPSAHLVMGVIPWGLQAFPPRRRVETQIRESIDIIDVEKFDAVINAA